MITFKQIIAITVVLNNLIVQTVGLICIEIDPGNITNIIKIGVTIIPSKSSFKQSHPCIDKCLNDLNERISSFEFSVTSGETPIKQLMY